MESPQKKSTIEEFLCSAELRGQVYSHLIILSVLHSFVFITGVLGNTLILIALYNESSLHPPSIVLYCNLFTLVLLQFLLLFYVSWLSVMKGKWTICRLVFHSSSIISHSLVGVLLLTTTAISVDWLLALLLRLRYRQTVTLKKTFASIITIICAASHLNIIVWEYRYTVLLCVFTSIFNLFLLKIFFKGSR